MLGDDPEPDARLLKRDIGQLLRILDTVEHRFDDGLFAPVSGELSEVLMYRWHWSDACDGPENSDVASLKLDIRQLVDILLFVYKYRFDDGRFRPESGALDDVLYY